MRSARYCQKMFVRSIEVGDNSAGMCNITELRQPENEREAVVRARVTSFAGVVASNRIGSREGCGTDFKNIERALDRIEDPWGRAAISGEARWTAERLIDLNWEALQLLADRLDAAGKLGLVDVLDFLRGRPLRPRIGLRHSAKKSAPEHERAGANTSAVASRRKPKARRSCHIGPQRRGCARPLVGGVAAGDPAPIITQVFGAR